MAILVNMKASFLRPKRAAGLGRFRMPSECGGLPPLSKRCQGTALQRARFLRCERSSLHRHKQEFHARRGAIRTAIQHRSGVGGGLNWFITDRLSLETKVTGLGSKLRVRIVGSDFVGVADLGWAQIYPISAVLQWHLLERGAVRPYIGAGAAHVILRNINKLIAAGATGVRFKDPTGLVLDGGLEFKQRPRERPSPAPRRLSV